MSKHTWCERLIAVLCIIAILLSSPFAPVSAEAAETGVKVTATTNASVKQGNTAYCYVYIDSLESLSTLEVTVHFDPAIVSVTGSYNQVNALLYDASAGESNVQYTYIFDGNGENTKTQLFYFEYTVLPTAPVGETYFDLVVGDAYDASFETLPVSGSRCSFRVAQAMNDLTCHVSGVSSVNTSVDQEFTLTYQFSTASIASGAAVIRYDPELFALVQAQQGSFLEGKLTDINTSLSGAVYLSFLGTTYNTGTQFLTLRFKTLQNVSKTDNITLTVTDLYDLELNAIRCSGYTTSVQISHDDSVDETAPRVYLQEVYDALTQKLTVQVCLEENSHLGAGDFVLHFDTDRFAYVSAEKGYSPTFFNINDKKIDEGLLKFSVISMTDQTQAATMLTATFDVRTPCEDTPALLTISGSGLADHLTNAIVLNFAGCTVETAGHTLVTDPYLAPTCLDTGLTEGNHCQVCQKVLLAQQVVPALGHDEIPHPAQAQTCTEIGWDAYVTCSRCDYTTYVEIPADGHRFHQSICTVCGATQEDYQSWDISAAGDGSLTAQLYRNHDGTYDLQITGSGAMTDWSDVSNVPWSGYQSLVTSLRLPEGLISIGTYAFYGCTGLTELTLPESLQSIDNRAFYGCTGLTQIRFNAVQMADLGSQNYVFAYCGTAREGITVTVGGNVKRIPAHLFNPRNGGSYVPKLTAVKFAQGSSCQSIGSYAFYSCAGLTELTLPEGLQTIETAAFSATTGLTQLTLPESLTAIGTGAFRECKGLTELTLPANLQTIGDDAFNGCTGLTQIHVNATQLTDLKQGNSVFLYCGNATEGITVTVGSNVKRIPAYLFYPHSNVSYAPKLKALTFAPDSVCQSIGSYAFRNGVWLTELVLPASLQTIGSYAFYNCTGLQTLPFHEGLQTIESYAFDGCSGLTELVLPASLQTIGYYAFSDCTGLQAINLPQGLQTLNSGAFYNCTGLTRIDLQSVRLTDLSSENHVFTYGGSAAEGITVTVGSGVTRIPTYLFYPTGGTEYSPKLQAVTFAPDSVCQSIGAYAFFACPALQTLHAADGLQTVEEYAFCHCTGLQSLTFGEGLQTVEDYAFYECTGLTELALPASLQTIESYAFGECTGLETINLPQMLQTLHNYAFYHCANLTQIRYDATQLADMEKYNQAFTYCGQNAQGITVTVGSNVERIPASLFYSYYNETGAPKLKTVLFTQGSTCQSIGQYAFYSCPGVRIGFSGDALPATVGTSWHSYDSVYYLNVEKFLETEDAIYVIFRDNTAELAMYTGSATQYRVLDTVDGAAVTAIGTNAFRNNATLTQVQLPDSVTQIQSWAFYGCSALTQITIPENVTSIDTGAFYQCVNVQSIAFHAAAMEDITSTNDVFYQNGTNTEGITVTIGPEVTRIPDNLFQTCYGASYNPKITSILFPENGVCQSIGRLAFYGLHYLKTIVIPETVTVIEEQALSYCTELTIGFAAAELPASLGNHWNGDSGYYLDVREFVLHDDATYVILNDNTAALGRYLGDGTEYEIAGEVGGAVVTRIGDHAFRSREKLERVTMPQSIQSIGNFAFCYCTSLSTVLLPESVAHIGSYAFSDCTKLTIGFASETGCQSLGEGWSGSSYIYYDVREFAVYEDATYALINDGDAIMCDYYGTAQQYDILQSVNGADVTTIGAGAFYAAQNLVNVSLPDTITRIGNEAFAYCNNLESITIPERVTDIGYSAFYNTLALKQICFHAVAANHLNSSNGVFYRAGRNGEGIVLTIGNQVTAIPAYLFDSYSSEPDQPKITQVIFEEGSVCKTIGTRAFAYISDFPEITLPESLETIGTGAFTGCAGLTQVILPEGLTTLNANAFQNCTALATVSLPDTLTTMGTNVFQNCTALTSIRLPDTLTTIGTYTFQNCTALAEVHLPAALKTIESYAFYNCAALQQIMIPEQVSAIGNQAFRNSGLKLVYICSDRIAGNTNSAAANGYLLEEVSVVVIRADLDSVSAYITDNYPNTMAITYQGADYISYSTDEHVWREYQVLVPFIACQQDGCIRYICDVCGAMQDVTTFRHDVVAHAGKEADCLNSGWHAYDTCSRCDYTTYTEIPALGHRVMVDGSIWVDAITTHNDETYPFSLRDGVYSSTNQVDNTNACYTITALYDCSISISYAVSSEENFDKLIIRKNGVTLVEISGEVDWASTVIELAAGDVLRVNYQKDGSVAQGQDTGWFRFTCPQVNVGADVPGPAEDAEPTCTEAVVCYFCQTLIKEALGHDLIGHEARQVTCLEIGWDAYDTCSRCDYSTYAEIPALGHDLISHEAKPVTCTEIGWEAYDTCSRCDYSTYAEIAPLGHDLQLREAQAPTCTEVGWEAYDACVRCDYSTYAEIPALGHDLIGHEAQQVTCLEIGWEAYDTCSRCDYSTYVEIPATGHSFMDKECIACGVDQSATRQWDVSLNGDGSVMAYAYAHMDGTYLIEILGSGPTTNNGYPFSALSGKIEDIYIGEGVTTLGDSLFSGLHIQGSIQIPESVSVIGAYAFYGFSGPKTVSLPASVTSIGDFAFYNAKELIVILRGDTLPGSLGSIWDYNCGHYLQPQQVITTEAATYVIDRDGKAWLAKCYVNLPEFVAETSVNGVPVTGIGAFAFDQKSAMITYTVPAQITEIGTYAFRECNKLTVLFESDSYPYGFSGGGTDGPPSYLAPQKVIRLEDRVYVLGKDGQMYLARYLGSARHVTVEAQVDGHPVQHIGDYAFAYRYSLQTLTLPDTIRTIGGYAFIHSTIKQISMPDSLTEIGTWGFFGADLTSVTIPEHVTAIQSNAFSYCEYLKVVYVRSPAIARNIMSTDACGDLCRYAQAVVIPADVENTWLSEHYAYREDTCVQGMDCVIYSNCAHDWQQTQVSEMIPCQSDGVEQFVCGVCTAEKTLITKCHDEIAHAAQIPDCTQIGWDAYETCSRCDYSTYVEIPALGHDLIGHEAQAATCLEIGWDAYDTCSRCDYTTYTEIPALGHDLISHEAKPVTCTEIGWDAYDTCSRCDYSTYAEIPALGHDLQQHEAQAPTCTEAGWDAYDTCLRCDYSTQQILPATGLHTFTDAADTQCDVCGQVFVLIRFATNGGTAVEQIRTLPGQTVSLSGVPEREGYRFAGWSATKNGDVAYGPDDAVCTDKSITLYAQWNQLCTTCQGSKRAKIDCDSCTDGMIRYEIDCPYCLGAGLVCRECDSITQCTDPNNHGIDLCTECENGKYAMYQECNICNGVGYTEQTCTDCNEWGETIRADGAAPEQPVLEKVEGSTVTLQTIENGEYSLDGIHWQERAVFENLQIGAEYCFYQRYVKTDTTLTSPASLPLTVKLKHAQAAPEAPMLLEKTQNSVSLLQNAGYEYSLDGIHWQKEAVFTGLSAETAYTFYQRIAETDTHYASPASMALTVTTAERTYVLGDINRDGRITAFDAQILAEAHAGLRTLTEEQLAMVGDLSPEDIIACILGKS